MSEAFNLEIAEQQEVNSVAGEPKPLEEIKPIPQPTQFKVIDNTQPITENALCLSLELSRIGTRRKVSSEAVETDADKDMIHVSKDILESKALEEIKKLDGEIRIFVMRKCLPAASMFRSGVYLIPLASLEKIDKKLEEYKLTRKELVNNFLAEYDTVIQEAEAKLGSLFDSRNYPDLEKVRSTFSMQTRYIAFNTPTKLKGLDPKIFQREVDKAREAVANCTEDIKVALRANMKDLVEHLCDKLTVQPDGSKKIFKNTSVNKFKEFLEEFNSKNITNDQELAVLVDKAKQLMEGVDPNVLRKDENLSENIKSGFDSIKGELDTMLVERTKRKISFED